MPAPTEGGGAGAGTFETARAGQAAHTAWRRAPANAVSFKSQIKTVGGGFLKNGLLCNDSRRSCARLFSHVQHSMSMILMVIN